MDHPSYARAAGVGSFGAELVATVRPDSGQARLLGCGRAVARDYVRLAALCGLVRCEIAESPKGNRRRRFMSRLGAAGARVGKLQKVEATGLLFWYALPNLGPVAEVHARPTSRGNQGILRTVRRTIHAFERLPCQKVPGQAVRQLHESPPSGLCHPSCHTRRSRLG